MEKRMIHKKMMTGSLYLYTPNPTPMPATNRAMINDSRNSHKYHDVQYADAVTPLL